MPTISRPAPSSLRWAKTPVAILLIAIVLDAVYGEGYVAYDGMYSLVWGRDMVRASVPEFAVPIAPTPHPLANALGGLASLFGDDGTWLFRNFILVSFAALGLAAFRLGHQLFSAPVGALFALVLLTRRLLVQEALQASIDIPFLALILWAAVLEARHQRRGAPVLLLLGVAGLLRPEAWVLAAGYGLYLAKVATPNQRLKIAALSLLAPAVWATHDLVITGDPLFSLHGTRDLAEQLDRPRGIDTAIRVLPVYLKFILFEPTVWLGIAGGLLAMYTLFERALVPVALIAIGVSFFLALGVAGLPLLVRYLLLPSTMLALFVGVAAFGWLSVDHRRWRLRVYWLAASGVTIFLLLSSVADDRARIDRAQAATAVRRDAQTALDDLVDQRRVRLALKECGFPIYVPNHRAVPLLAYRLGESPQSFVVRAKSPRRGLVFLPATPAVASIFSLDPAEPAPLRTAPRRFAAVARNESWRTYARC